MLSFQRLDVYQRATEFLALAVDICRDVTRGNAGIVDQLRRAALSIPLNIAEAAGRTGAAVPAADQGHVAVAVAVNAHDHVNVYVDSALNYQTRCS